MSPPVNAVDQPEPARTEVTGTTNKEKDAAAAALRETENHGSRRNRYLTGLLFCLTSGTFAIAFIEGGRLWIPAAMMGALSLYRIAILAVEHPAHRHSQELDQFDDIRARMEHLETSRIPEERRYILSAALERKLARIVSKNPTRT